MDFYAETEKGKQKFLAEIGELSYRRYMAEKTIEESEKLIANLDQEIARREAALREADRAQRNFSTYLAIKEGAITTEELAEAIHNAGEIPDKEEPKKPAKRKEK